MISKNKILLLFLVFFFNTMYSQDKVIGTWLTSDGKSHIKIFKHDDKFYGRVTWLKDSIDPSTSKLYLDIHNPDSTFRNRQVLGLVILVHFKYDEHCDCYSGGKFYFPRDGKTYRGKMWLTDANTLQMRGYVFIFHKTDVWKRIE